MSTARTTCPGCTANDSNVVDLADLLFSVKFDYFRCRACGCWWMVPKGADGPAMLIAVAAPNASVIAKKAS
jgi:hypothetical protein